jgi:hypothetical protein
MGSNFLYSTNPAFSHDLAEKYLDKKHFVWCSDDFEPLGAPSSSPKEIYRGLLNDCEYEDTHSHLINNYKKTFRRLASSWLSNGIITDQDKEDILAMVNSTSWKIWRPQLYIISRSKIVPSSRLHLVPPAERAARGDEWQIKDLDSSEFEILEWRI